VKKLVTKRNIHDYLIEGENEFYVDSSMIISPGAKDILRNKGIVIVYGHREENCSKEITECKEVSCLDIEEKSDSELRIIKTIENLLVQEFKVTDAQMIKEIISKVLNKI
jgi:hypothetical protein